MPPLHPGRTAVMYRLLLLVLCSLAVTSPLSAQRVKLVVPLEDLVRRAQVDSNDAQAHYDVALGYWVKKDYAAADRHLREAITIDPAHASAKLALSYLPYARREKLWDEEEAGKVPAEWQPQVEEADRLRREAFLIDPMVDLKPVALMIPPTGTFGLNSRQKNVYTYIMNGLGSFWVGDYATAMGFFKELNGNATPEQHDQFASWFLWYEALASAHGADYTRAITNVEILKKRAEESINQTGGASLAFSNANHYRYTLATLLHLAGRDKEAIPLLEEVLTVDAGLYYGHSRLAAIYADQRRTNASLEERRRAITVNPDNPVLLYDLGEALARAGEVAEAYTVLQSARKANPRNARAHYIFGWVAQQVGDKDGAREAYTTFLAMAPSRYNDQKAEATKRLALLQ